MSTGIVVCSECDREIHQDGPRDPVTQSTGWTHCEDKTPRCAGATTRYPVSKSAIVGRWCGADESPF